MAGGTGPKKPRTSSKKTKPSPTRTSKRLSVSERLEAIRATGLFTDLDAARLAELRITLTRDTDLVEAIEAHLRSGPKDIVLRSPQSTSDLLAVEGIDVSSVIGADVEPRIAHVAGAMYAPETFHEWAGTFNLALRHLDDARRAVALHVEDAGEPLYVLATPPQIEALRAANALAWDSERVRTPARISATERAAVLAQRLSHRKLPARSDGEEIVLDFADLTAAIAFAERVRRDVHHGVRVGVLVNAEYAKLAESEP